MITIIHGDDIASSRKYFSSLKSGADNPTAFSGNALSVTQLAQVLEGGGLFGHSENIFIEDFLTHKKQGTESQAISKYLLDHAGEHNIYIWEGKEVSKTTLTQYNKSIVKLFKVPQVLFQFLDSVRPGNTKIMVELFHKAVSQSEVEMLFYMLIRHFRILLATRSHAAIEETKRQSDWQRSKYQKQAALFSEASLKNHYYALYTIDRKQKSGGLPYDLLSSIDFFLLDL